MYRPIAIRFSYHFTYLISPLMTRHDTLSTCIMGTYNITLLLVRQERPIAAIVYNGIAAPNSSLVCRADSSTPSRRPAPLLDVPTS